MSLSSASPSGSGKKQSRKSSSKSRPASSLASLASPIAASSPSTLSSFSSDGQSLALLSQALDRHRLRIYDCNAQEAGEGARLKADHVLPSGRVVCIAWGGLPVADTNGQAATIDAPSDAVGASKKKRRKSANANGNVDSLPATTNAPSPRSQSVLALGLQDGSIQLFSPSLGKVVRVLNDAAPSSASDRAVRSLLFAEQGSVPVLHAACADSLVRTWSLAPNAGKAGTSSPQRTPVQDVAALASGQDKSILAASHNITRLEVVGVGGAQGSEARAPIYKASKTWTGHASSITHLVPLFIQEQAFISAAEGDRVLTLWGSSARPLASLPLESAVRRVDSFSSDASTDLILSITVAGTAAIHHVPSSIDPAAKKVQSLEKASSVVLRTGKNKEVTPLLDAHVHRGILSVAALLHGSKLVVERMSLLDETGKLPKEISLVRSGSGGLLSQGDTELGEGAAAAQRYKGTGHAPTANTSGNLSTGELLGSNSASGLIPDADVAAPKRFVDEQADLDAQVDADAAEPTLAARLKSLGVGASAKGFADVKQSKRSGSAGTGAAAEEDESEAEADDAAYLAQKAPLESGGSLAQTLIQALHSDDSAMLSSCLAHSDPGMIRETVRRISGPIAVKLLEAAVSTMSAGQRSKGAIGSQRARGLIEWIKAALTAHAGYLMSLPDLVNRLAVLHATLSRRISSHERLLALSGRLELVLAQIEFRTAYTAQQAAQRQVQGVSSKRGKGARGTDETKEKRAAYVWKEGDSDEDEEEEEEEEEEEMDVDEDVDEDEEESSDSEGDEPETLNAARTNAFGADSDDEDVEVIRPQRRQSNSARKALDSDQEDSDGEEEEEDDDDVSRVSSRRGGATSAESDEEGEYEDESMGEVGLAGTAKASNKKSSMTEKDDSASEDAAEEAEDSEDDDDEEEDEEEDDDDDESEEEDDSEEVSDEEEDDSDAEGERGLIDDEAEEASDDEEEEESD